MTHLLMSAVEMVRMLGSPKSLAQMFCELNDEQQADFFIEVGEASKAWGPAGRSMQAFKIGNHLKTCSCSTFEAREFVRDVSEAANGR